jgi:hypothetical protein
VAELAEDAVRNTILYRTLLHEIGHLADYQQKVLEKETSLDPDPDVAADLWLSIPTSEREAFAHKFAEELKQTLLRNGAIPIESQPFAKADL